VFYGVIAVESIVRWYLVVYCGEVEKRMLRQGGDFILAQRRAGISHEREGMKRFHYAFTMLWQSHSRIVE